MRTMIRRRKMLSKSLLTIAVVPLAARALAIGEGAAAGETPAPAPEQNALLGPWFVSAGQVSIIISVEPGRQALVVFDEKGAITIGRHAWRSLPGGALIDTLPRFRLWHVADSAEGGCEVRVQMETLPEQIEISTGIKNFPRRFCMKRVDHAPLPPALAERPLPKDWDSEKPSD